MVKRSFLVALAVGLLLGSRSPAQVPAANTTVHFVVIGDRTGGHQAGVYDQIIGEIQRLKPDFAVTVGDQIEGYTDDSVQLKSQWAEYFTIVKPLTMPVYLTPGNHDITTDAALPVFRSVVGDPYRSFDVGDRHFIILDNSRWESSDQLPKEELDWLASDLALHATAPEKFVFFHKPFWYNSVAVGKANILHSLFVMFGVTAVFSGHFHRYFSGKYDGIMYTAVGSSGAEAGDDPSGIGYHFLWVTADSGEVSVSPVKLGGVEAWDKLGAEDMHHIDKITRQGVTFDASVPVSGDLTVSKGPVTVKVQNLAKNLPVTDTLRWTTADGWKVEPKLAPLTIPAGGSVTLKFEVTGAGPLYPTPQLSLKLPFAAGQSVPVTRTLPIARTALCRHLDKVPIIDGNIDDPAWKAPVTGLFGPDGSPVSIESTFCYFAYDRNNLYLAMKCRESRTDSLRASTTARDGGVFGEDCVGYFLQPDLKKDTVYQIYFNALGTVFDQKISRFLGDEYSGDKSWNGTYTVKSSRGQDYWSVEAQIPLSQLGLKAKPGTRCGINFLRKQQRLHGAADWQVPIDYDPKSFGVLLFE